MLFISFLGWDRSRKRFLHKSASLFRSLYVAEREPEDLIALCTAGSFILPALVITGFQLSALPLIDTLRIHVASLDVRGNVTIIQIRSIDTLISLCRIFSLPVKLGKERDNKLVFTLILIDSRRGSRNVSSMESRVYSSRLLACSLGNPNHIIIS